MRSIWSADRILALLAAASLEGAWLTLVYIGLQWWAGNRELDLGIGQFALGAVVGILLARRIRGLSRWLYATAVIVVAVLVGATGAWLEGSAPTSFGDIAAALVGHPAAWILGVAILRGTGHGDPDDESTVAERVLNRGVPGLVAFWIVASLSGLASSASLEGMAFAATLTFLSAGLLSLGLARLTDLEVEAVHPARRQWLALLLGISALLLVVGVPLAAVLGLPFGTALAGIAGPLAPLLGALLTVAAVPAGLLLEGLVHLVGALGIGRATLPPVPIASAEASAAARVLPSGPPPDLSWLLWIAIAIVTALIILAVAAMLRRPELDQGATTAREVREAERIEVGPLPQLPRIRMPRIWRRPPTSAIEAYRLVLASLVGREDERRLGETPREHAARAAGERFGPSLTRLAADYQLSALAGRQLSAAEERRAVARWRRITRELR
jgi:hypothetical protein